MELLKNFTIFIGEDIDFNYMKNYFNKNNINVVCYSIDLFLDDINDFTGFFNYEYPPLYRIS